MANRGPPRTLLPPSQTPGAQGATRVIAPPITNLSASASETSGKSAMDIGTEMYMANLEKVILPAISQFYNDNYDVYVSPEELARGAFNLVLPLNNISAGVSYSASTPGTKENTNRKRQIDPVGGCQYIMDRSRKRRGEACGDRRDHPSYFCKQCKKKKAFPEKAEKLAEQLGLSFEEVAGPDAERPGEVVTKKPAQRRAPGPSRGGRAANAPISHPRAPEIPLAEQVTDQPESALTLEAMEIEGLQDILYDSNSNIVFYCSEDGSEIVAFGQWSENDKKIARMTEPVRLTAKQHGMQIGEYTHYNIGAYSVDEPLEEEEEEETGEEMIIPSGIVENAVKPMVPPSSFSAPSEERVILPPEKVIHQPATEVSSPLPLSLDRETVNEPSVQPPEERLHQIPGRRSLRRN